MSIELKLTAVFLYVYINLLCYNATKMLVSIISVSLNF
jgi:hypothetical protein